MKKFYLLSIFLILMNKSIAQNPVLIRYDYDNLNSYSFYALNNEKCNYTIEITMSNLKNLPVSFEPYKFIVSPGDNYLFRLTKIDPKLGTDFKYSYKFYKGCYKTNPTSGYVYLLPVKPNLLSPVFKINFIGSKYFGEVEPLNYNNVGIKMNFEDTVFASRSGVVSEVIDNYVDTLTKINSNGTYSYVRNINYIEIFHSDCTFGIYENFKFKSFFVKKGDFVNAGDPIGIVGGFNFKSGPHVRFSVYYRYMQDIKKKSGEETGLKYKYAYVQLLFWTKEKKETKLDFEKKYTSEHPDSLVTLEMSKREKKKWLKKKSKY